MHDREFVKPLPIVLRLVLQGQPQPQDLLYGYDQYVGEFVWAYGKWNAEEAWQEAQIRIGEALEAAEASKARLVKFEDIDDWEKFNEANKAAVIQGPMAHRIRRFQKAGKGARKPFLGDADSKAQEAEPKTGT